MVRKIVCITAILCCCLSLTSNAFAYTSYNQGNISTTYVQYFDDIIDGLPVNHSYVAARTGQYEYILHSSDNLKYSNGQFTSNDGITYKFSTNGSYNSTYDYSVNIEHGFSLNTNSQMVYSSIGDFPRLDERGSLFEFAIIFTAVVCCICLLIRPIFKYVLRIR